MSVTLFELQAPAIRDRLRHNILPSDAERRAIMESLVVARRRLVEIPIGVSDTVARYAERAALHDYISEYSSLLAPIRRLTHDILERVFTDPETSQMIRIGRITPAHVVGNDPYLLASVCHYWMCVALQTHELWSKFDINAFGDARALNQMRACLERSGTLPLSIGLTIPPAYTLPLVSRELLNELMSNAERWGRLWISTPKDDVALLAPVHGRLHQLQEISFHCDTQGTSDGLPNAFEVAPKLRTVRFEGLRNIDEIYVLPFRQIRTVEFCSAGSSVCCDALLKFPDVRDIVITDCRGGLAQHPQLQVTLKKITLGRDDGDQRNAMAVLLRRLTAPNLEALHFFDYIWESTSVTEFLTRSACSLKILFLKDVRVRAGELLTVLRHTPALCTLVLRNSIPNALTDMLILALTPVSGSETLLPALKNIVFVGSYLFSTNTVLRMLEERAASLRFVNLVLTNRQVAAADGARFAALRTASPGIWRLSCLTEARKPAVQ
ncbi:hypothetical protein C8R47DRAFT_616150 [Mycena vitilis]|nr:hypothetical protein C8R47DRAFT_616150 [Mycena vitilis]